MNCVELVFGSNMLLYTLLPKFIVISIDMLTYKTPPLRW